MRISKTLFAITVVVLVAVGAAVGATWASAQQRKPASHVLLPPEDYNEIQQLYGLYARSVDPGSRRDASWLFAQDGVFKPNEQTFTGQKELKDWFLQLQKRFSHGTRHFSTSYVIIGTPDGGARGSAYMMTVEQKGEGKPVEVTGFGKYEDRFVKTPDGWRFKERIYRAEPFQGSTEAILPSPLPGDR